MNYWFRIQRTINERFNPFIQNGLLISKDCQCPQTNHKRFHWSLSLSFCSRSRFKAPRMEPCIPGKLANNQVDFLDQETEIFQISFLLRPNYPCTHRLSDRPKFIKLEKIIQHYSKNNLSWVQKNIMNWSRHTKIHRIAQQCSGIYFFTMKHTKVKNFNFFCILSGFEFFEL